MASWTYTKNFDGLNDGDLNGQDSWSGSVLHDVQTSVKYTGTKAIAISPPGDDVNYLITRALPASVDSGTFYIAMQTSNKTGLLCALRLYSGTTLGIRIGLGWSVSGNITIGGKTNVTLVSGYTAGQWYKLGVKIIDATHYQGNVDDGSWSSSVESSAAGAIDTIKLDGDTTNTGTAYFDDITLPASPSTAVSNLSLLGVG